MYEPSDRCRRLFRGEQPAERAALAGQPGLSEALIEEIECPNRFDLRLVETDFAAGDEMLVALAEQFNSRGRGAQDGNREIWGGKEGSSGRS